MATITDTQLSALRDFLAFDGYTLGDLGPKLTCAEADAWAGLLRAFDLSGKANDLLSSHAEGDDEGESHYEYKRGNS